MKRVISIIITMLLLISILSSCQNYDVIYEGSNNYPPISPLPGDKTEIVLYYPNNKMKFLLPEIRLVSRSNEELANVVIQELLKGTDKNKLRNIIPREVKLLSAEVIDDTAYVNFSKEILKDYSEKEEAFVIYSIVNSLTSISSIKKVQILIDGKMRNVLTKYYLIREPLSFSSLIVNKDYASPIDIVKQYYDYITQENLNGLLSIMKIEGNDNINYNTKVAYLKSNIDYIDQYNLIGYTMSGYSNNIEVLTGVSISTKEKVEEKKVVNFKIVNEKGNFKITETNF
ncbi:MULTISPECIES: GerMN domain-containing protein [Tissierellales]|nr:MULTISPECIES: GerMN domain-containing protein [Tissierellales]SCL84248.1 Spore germination protein [Sporanaerobacter sp. PP17-6a]